MRSIIIPLLILLSLCLEGASLREPVGYWSMDGKVDYQGVVSKAPRFVGSYVGLGLRLPFSGLTPKTSPEKIRAFSIEAWLWIEESGGSCLIYSSRNSHGFGIDGGKPFITCNTVKWVPKGILLKPRHWYFLVATFDGDHKTLYINGKQVAFVRSPMHLHSGSPVVIGASSVGFRGILDEVKLYDHALPQETILSHFNAVPRVVALWSFDDDARDKSGLSHHGKLINGTRFRNGKINRCLYFDGINDYALFSNQDQSLDPGMNFSIEAWIYCQTFKQDWQHIYDKYRSMTISVKGGCFGMSGRGGWWVPGNAGLKARHWHHVVATYSVNQRRIYIDGSPVAVQPVGVGANYGDVVYVSNPYFPFHGFIDEVKIYMDTLSPSEILNRYQAVIP